MTIIRNDPGAPNPLGMTDEPDWRTLLDYTGEVTEEVIQSWWGAVPPGSYPAVRERLARMEAENPELAAMIRRVTKLPTP